MLRLNAKNCGHMSNLGPFLVIVASAVLVTSSANAHFRLTAPACWLSQDTNGSPQKDGPCAAFPNDAGLEPPIPGTRSNIVSNFQPGQMVTVSVTATISHPGWYRVALAEGPSSSQTLTSIPDPAQTQGTCKPTIMTNPVWSPTQPVIADGLPAGSGINTLQSGSQNFQVRIPANANCTAQPCTLQVIMVMTDHPANDCYYHHCADITVGGDAGSTPSGGNDAGARDASSGAAGRPIDSGTSTGAG